jgi:CheY-like chemotaxis protein
VALGNRARPGGLTSILVVEDDADTRQALGEYLGTLFPESRLLMTESGESALELIQRTRPSVVILDLRLQGITGFEFAERARRLPSAMAVPIVALTGDMSPDTLMRAEAAGFFAFLRKPADLDRLETVLRPLLEREPGA